MIILIVMDDEDDGDFLAYACKNVAPHSSLTCILSDEFNVDVFIRHSPTHLFILTGMLDSDSLLRVQSWIEMAVAQSSRVIVFTSFWADEKKFGAPGNVTVIPKPVSLSGLKRDIQIILSR